MCASNELKMEPANVSRFNSQSTGNVTLVGSDGRASPEPPLVSAIEQKPGHALVYLAQENKQWIHLDSISPKLLRELRKRYDPEYKEDVKIKSTDKIKAWARQSKLGIDLRLRRKVSMNRDEVTDITLVPDYAKPLEAATAVEPWYPELPAEQRVSELPDTSVSPVSELPAEPENRDTRPLSLISSSDTLPVYQRFEEPLASEPTAQPANVSASVASPIVSEHGSTEAEQVDTDYVGSETDAAIEARISGTQPSFEQKRIVALQKSLAVTQQKVDEQEKINESVRAMLEMLQRKTTETQDAMPEEENSLDAKRVLQHFQVSRPSIYETETDIEPSSPSSSRKSGPSSPVREPRPVRKPRSPIQPRKKRSHGKNVLASGSAGVNSTPPGSDGLVRRQTIPKQTPANADMEDLWTSLISSGANLLGPEHPLLYQARTDLARSRAKHHKSNNLLGTLWECRRIAGELLGAHPSVSKFVTDLETLTEMMGHSVLDANLEMSQKTTDLASEMSVADLNPAGASTKTEDPEKTQTPTSSGTVAAVLPPERMTPPNNSDRPQLPTLDTAIPSITLQEAPPSPEKGASQDLLFSTRQPPHKPRSDLSNFSSLVIDTLIKGASQGLAWVQKNYGPEPRVPAGKVRVRWTCSCGEALHDDYIETRPGAARELEAYLNRPRTHTGPETPVSPSSSAGSRSFTNSSLGGPPSSQTSWSSLGMSNGQSPGNGNSKQLHLSTGSLPIYTPYHPPEPPWLLTCANEDRYTPKLSHIDMSRQKVRSDKDLALALREHYYTVNKKWYRTLRLRGLSSIEFVQFEVHQNRFCDLRKVPDMPPPSRTDDYDFTPGDLLPPVGSTYLLHLFKHPEDYDGELITYLRSPKKSSGRLSLGVGWGINLVEGFEATRVWTLMSMLFILGSTTFGIVWATIKQDIQGAFGVAAWILALAIMMIGWAQASFG